MQTVKQLAKAVALFVLVAVCLRYLGDFSPKQTVAIVIVIAVLGYFYQNFTQSIQAARRREINFTPYRVVVRPNWPRLLLDYKLLKDEEALQQLWEKGLEETLPISFTVLQPQHDVDLPGLVYWDGRKCFVRGVDFEEPIKGIVFKSCLEDQFQSPVLKDESSAPDDFLFTLSPEVYCKIGLGLGRGGYELGLAVREAWWDLVRAKGDIGEVASTKADTNHVTGETRLMVATLPLSEFDMYYRDFEFDDNRRRKQGELIDRELARCGWKREEHDPFAEVPDPWQHLEHKYFSIQHRSI